MRLWLAKRVADFHLRRGPDGVAMIRPKGSRRMHAIRWSLTPMFALRWAYRVIYEAEAVATRSLVPDTSLATPDWVCLLTWSVILALYAAFTVFLIWCLS